MMIVVILTLISCISCNTTTESEIETTPSQPEITIDSLAIALHQLDSISNCGTLLHADIYKIGSLKSITITVQQITTNNTSFSYINFRKDCGGDYYYSWENARLLDKECPYLIDAIKTIMNNLDRTVNHEERYAYITKDNIRIISENTNNGLNWSIQLSVDYLKSNSTVTLTAEDLQSLLNLIIKAQEKIRELDDNKYIVYLAPNTSVQ